MEFEDDTPEYWLKQLRFWRHCYDGTLPLPPGGVQIDSMAWMRARRELWESIEARGLTDAVMALVKTERL